MKNKSSSHKRIGFEVGVQSRQTMLVNVKIIDGATYVAIRNPYEKKPHWERLADSVGSAYTKIRT